MKNWKTTLGGLAGGLASVFAGLALISKGATSEGATALLTGLGLIWTGWSAKDKTSP